MGTFAESSVDAHPRQKQKPRSPNTNTHTENRSYNDNMTRSSPLQTTLAVLVASLAILSPAVNARRLVNYSDTAVMTEVEATEVVVEGYAVIPVTPSEGCICVVLEDCEC